MVEVNFATVTIGVSLVVAWFVRRLVAQFVEQQYAKMRSCCESPAAKNGVVRSSPLYSYDNALPYLQGNPYITHGYRQNYTVRQTLQSLFSIHNETANIWSHFLGGLLFFYYTIASMYDLLLWESHSDRVHQATVVVYCCGAMCLLACSTSFHWWGCVSDEVYRITAKLDYTGIAVMILVSFFPFMYSMFYCNIGWGIFYTVCISALTAMAIFVSWSETFQKPGYHTLRAGLFIAVGLFGGFPMPHAAFALGVDKSWPVLWPLLTMGAIYIGGALLYAMRIPERFIPGKLNIIGHSHFLFHCCVVGAAVLHYWNVGRVLAWRDVVFGDCKAYWAR